ncbi:RTA1-domain-containing protein [Flagelloscypha sp. PMI_526]|nr:RTA1-domain-containing protein [Flagelloscypha sp. PMI_526]
MNSTTIPLEQTPVFRNYGYVPTKYVCFIFLGLFTLSAILHVGQAIWSKKYWFLTTAVFCCALEAAGWGMRLWSNMDLMNKLGFKLQLCFTIIAPTPLLAVNFILIGQTIPLLGPQFSRLSAKYYSLVFLSCDIIALVVQAAGGAMAATADDPTLGGHVMLGGIVFQTFAITMFCLITFEFFYRHYTARPVRSGPNVPLTNGVVTNQLKVLFAGLAFNTVCLYVRAMYRLLELVDGWNGVIIQTEWYFNVFDGAMIILATYTWNLIHPMFWLPETVPSKHVPLKLSGMEMDSVARASVDSTTPLDQSVMSQKNNTQVRDPWV